MMDTAGKYLKNYEQAHYSWTEKYFRKIILPPQTEDFYDVSFYQAGLNWTEYRKHARAAILRLGQGAWVDLEFDNHYKHARENGVALGGYLFYDGRHSPNQHVQTVLNALSGKTLEMEVFVDWEHNYGGAYEGLRYVVTLMKMLQAAGVSNIGIYTGYYYFLENTLNDQDYYPYLVDKPLWLAWYASPDTVKVPKPWIDWTYWQAGTPIVDWAPTKELDFNHYNGSPLEFATRYLGGSMYVKGTVNASAGLNIRQSPSLDSVILGKLPYGTEVFGFLENGWIKGTFNGVNGYLSAQYVTYVPAPAPVIKPVQQVIDLAAGSVVTTKYSDGTVKVETA